MRLATISMFFQEHFGALFVDNQLSVFVIRFVREGYFSIKK